MINLSASLSFLWHLDDSKEDIEQSSILIISFFEDTYLESNYVNAKGYTVCC